MSCILGEPDSLLLICQPIFLKSIETKLSPYFQVSTCCFLKWLSFLTFIFNIHSTSLLMVWTWMTESTQSHKIGRKKQITNLLILFYSVYYFFHSCNVGYKECLMEWTKSFFPPHQINKILQIEHHTTPHFSVYRVQNYPKLGCTNNVFANRNRSRPSKHL